jgi:hypothetical protein
MKITTTQITRTLPVASGHASAPACSFAKERNVAVCVSMPSDPSTLTWPTSGTSGYLVARGEGHVRIQGLFAPAAVASKLASSNTSAANKQARANKAANAAAKRSLDRTGPPGG